MLLFMTESREGDVSAPRHLTVFEAQVFLTMRETSNLVRHEDAPVIAGFLDLCRRTLEWLPPGLRQPFRLDPGSACCAVVQIHLWREVVPRNDVLLEEWRRWPDQYAELLTKNPRREMADMIGWIGECIDAASWPYDQEGMLRSWIDSEARTPTPFLMWTGSENDLDDTFFDRLRTLRQATGGWCWYDDLAGAVVFRPD